MRNARHALLLSLSLGAALAASMSPASASSAGPLAKRGGYVVSPTMMHAIDVIVAEKTRTRHHAR